MRGRIKWVVVGALAGAGLLSFAIAARAAATYAPDGRIET